MNGTEAEIARYRKGEVELKVLKANGEALAEREIGIRQTKGKFLFGVAGFDVPFVGGKEALGGKEEPERVERMLALFNSVTLPFYWARFEPRKGQPNTERMKRAAQWCRARGLSVKGHPLCWHTLTAEWLLAMEIPDIFKAQTDRIMRDAGDFRGLIDAWDVVNEAVIMPVFDKYENGITRLCREMGRIETIRAMFGAARAADPGATLFLNDFDTSSAYDILVEGCLEAGIKIDAIGIQSHMHQGYWGEEKTMRVLERFSRFKLPIHFTETTLVSGSLMPREIVDLNDFKVDEWPTSPEGEERQADETLRHYTTLFAHPLVEGITWWDLADGGWLKAPSGLLRKDGSPKPAYGELLRLVKGEWTTAPLSLKTDANGKAGFVGFLGDYEMTCGGERAGFSASMKGRNEITIRL